MQFPVCGRAIVALVCLFAAAFAVLPLMAVAQTLPGTILFSRTTYSSAGAITASSIFSIGDDGLNERQLTPHVDGQTDIPGVGSWVTNAFNPQGTYSVFLRASYSDQRGYYDGKYFIINAYGVVTPPLFSGSDDLQDPSVGPGYGSVTWGPANNDQIAYSNAPDVHTTGKHPACVHLMQSNGSNGRCLWCADRWTYWGIEAIRWSGDGSSLIAYAVHTSNTLLADLYVINATTGAATLVATNLNSPHNGGGFADISYDGHEVIYPGVHGTNDPVCDPPSGVLDWCAKNLQTGHSVALVDPSNVVTFDLYDQPTISPDGSQVFLVGTSSKEQSQDYELYAIKTDGSDLHQITSQCVPIPSGSYLLWESVRVSPDGTQLLANCRYDQGPSRESQIWVVSLTNGISRFVTNGVAYDWHKQ